MGTNQAVDEIKSIVAFLWQCISGMNDNQFSLAHRIFRWHLAFWKCNQLIVKTITVFSCIMGSTYLSLLNFFPLGFCQWQSGRRCPAYSHVCCRWRRTACCSELCEEHGTLWGTCWCPQLCESLWLPYYILFLCYHYGCFMCWHVVWLYKEMGQGYPGAWKFRQVIEVLG